MNDTERDGNKKINININDETGNFERKRVSHMSNESPSSNWSGESHSSHENASINVKELSKNRSLIFKSGNSTVTSDGSDTSDRFNNGAQFVLKQSKFGVRQGNSETSSNTTSCSESKKEVNFDDTDASNASNDENVNMMNHVNSNNSNNSKNSNNRGPRNRGPIRRISNENTNVSSPSDSNSGQSGHSDM